MDGGNFNRWLLALFLVAWCASCISVPYPTHFPLQHVPTVFAVIGLVVLDKRIGIDRSSYSLVIAFLLLHVLGARYLYSFVPYDDWSQRFFNFRISDSFGFERNHYDRLVHFAFGLLMVNPLCQFFEKYAGFRALWPAAAAICVVLAASAIYEIIEWSLAMLLAPDWAEAYNGQQGDIWDAQKDMALAAGGSILAAGVIVVSRRYKHN